MVGLTASSMKIEPKGQGLGTGGASDPTDDRPDLRAGHTLSWGANHLFIFGGTLAYEQRKANDLYITNLDRMVWMKMQPSGERPIERDGHCAVFDPVRKRLLVFGGRHPEEAFNDGTNDMVSNTWSKMAPRNLPRPRVWQWSCSTMIPPFCSAVAAVASAATHALSGPQAPETHVVAAHHRGSAPRRMSPCAVTARKMYVPLVATTSSSMTVRA